MSSLCFATDRRFVELIDLCEDQVDVFAGVRDSMDVHEINFSGIAFCMTDTSFDDDAAAVWSPVEGRVTNHNLVLFAELEREAVASSAVGDEASSPSRQCPGDGSQPKEKFDIGIHWMSGGPYMVWMDSSA